MGPDLFVAVLHDFERALHAKAEVALDLVDVRAWDAQNLPTPSTVPVFLHEFVEGSQDQLAPVASLVHTDLAESADKNLVFLEIITVLAHIAGDERLIAILLNHDLLVVAAGGCLGIVVDPGCESHLPRLLLLGVQIFVFALARRLPLLLEIDQLARLLHLVGRLLRHFLRASLVGLAAQGANRGS